MATLDELDAQLRTAAKLLDGGASIIRDVGLNSQTNIRRIAEALVLVFEIQQEIYAVRPDLSPDFLKPPE